MQSISILYTFLYNFNVLSTHNSRHALFILFPSFIFPFSFLHLVWILPGNFSLHSRRAQSNLTLLRQEILPVNYSLLWATICELVSCFFELLFYSQLGSLNPTGWVLKNNWGCTSKIQGLGCALWKHGQIEHWLRAMSVRGPNWPCQSLNPQYEWQCLMPYWVASPWVSW